MKLLHAFENWLINNYFFLFGCGEGVGLTSEAGLMSDAGLISETGLITAGLAVFWVVT